MNLDTSRRELHRLDQFLQQEENHRLDILLEMLKVQVGEEYRHVASLLNQNDRSENQTPRVSTVIYQKAGSSGQTVWLFKIYHCLTEDDPDLISRILMEQLTSPDNEGANAKLSFVLCDKKVLAQFQNVYRKYISQIALSENKESHAHQPDVSFIFGDIVNREIKENQPLDSADPDNNAAL